MPFVTIHLMAGRSPTHLRQIADGTYEALQKTFDVPAADRFQAIHQCSEEERILDDSYLGVKRSDDVILIHIASSATRSLQQKGPLCAGCAQLGSEPWIEGRRLAGDFVCERARGLVFRKRCRFVCRKPVREEQ